MGLHEARRSQLFEMTIMEKLDFRRQAGMLDAWCHRFDLGMPV
jgi:hypothetical protein